MKRARKVTEHFAHAPQMIQRTRIARVPSQSTFVGFNRQRRPGVLVIQHAKLQVALGILWPLSHASKLITSEQFDMRCIPLLDDLRNRAVA